MVQTMLKVRSVTAGLVAALGTVLMVPLATPVWPQEDAQRFGGEPAEVAAAFSRIAFPDGAPAALLAREDLFADALASGGAQAAVGGPLLLSDRTRLPEVTSDELARLGVQIVHLLGGTAAIGDEVAADLRRAGFRVRRHAGSSRIETAVAVAGALMPDSTTVLLSRGYGDDTSTSPAFADVVGAGALAASVGAPLLPTSSDRLSDAVAEHLSSAGVDTVVVVGGAGAVGETVVDDLRQLGLTTQRVAGPDRIATALALLRHRGITAPAAVDTVVAVDADDELGWVDGFAAAALAGRSGVALVLVDESGARSDVADLVRGSAANVICGHTVREPACSALEELVRPDACAPDGAAACSPSPVVGEQCAQPGEAECPPPADPPYGATPAASPGVYTCYDVGEPYNSTMLFVYQVNADPPGDDLAPGAGEYVHLTTSTAKVPRDVTGYYLQDASGNRLTLGARVVERGLVVHTGPGENDERNEYNHLTTAVLDNGGDVISIHAPDGELVDSCTYP